jgi:anion-transporting  ArsA/GET3 family ATPase
MKKELQSAKVIVCVGTGGVGKTTMAAAIGYWLAKQGRKTLVLTVDPAQRLKTTFGLKTAGEWILVTENLWASVVDPRKTFDDFVRKASGDDPSSEKLFQNNLYQQLTTTLSGSQEFTSLENLLSAVNSGKFDVVVLDTPPAQHAIDFLNAPQKLALIFSEGIAKWFRDPLGKKENFWRGLVQTGTKQVLKILEKLTGSQFVSELADFFQKIHAWQGKLEARATEAHRLLVSTNTHFLLVTGFDEAKFKESLGFTQEIRKTGYQISGVIVNRAFPNWFQEAHPEGSALQKKFEHYYQERQKTIDNFAERLGNEISVVTLPEQNEDVHDLEGVVGLSKIFETRIKGEF